MRLGAIISTDCWAARPKFAGMAKKAVVTAAVRVLRDAGIGYTEHLYKYIAGGGATDGADQLGLDPHRVVKTLILETSDGDALCLLMHGDREVSMKGMARHLAVKAVEMARDASRHSGYEIGGTSPFGLRQTLPVYCEATILDFDSVVINGGKRGFLIEITTEDLVALLDPELVEVGI